MLPILLLKKLLNLKVIQINSNFLIYTFNFVCECMCVCNTAVQMWESGDNSSKSAYFREEFEHGCFIQVDRLLATLHALIKVGEN